MREKLKYVNYYNHALTKGCLHGMQVTPEHALRMDGAQGAYISRMFDTGTDDETFNRLAIEGDFEGLKLEVIVAATNETDVILDDRVQTFEQYLGSAEVPLAAKTEVMTHIPHVRMVNSTDLLLHDLKGRYVWICVILYSAGELTGLLKGMRLEFPKYSFVEYFPEIYQGNRFFERYLAVFQSAFLDMERDVEYTPQLLDYQRTPDGYVEYLAGWLGIDNSHKIFSPDQLRKIIEEIDILQGGKGTRYTLERIVEMLTGIRPRIVEHFQWSEIDMPPHARQTCQRLYGETSDDFCVIMDISRSKDPLALTQKEMDLLVESYSVIGTRFRIVYLTDCNHLDAHCYLDINSRLSIPETAAINREALGSHITIG